ncbi:hypothetical protein EJ05DRAFT_445395 [Pseudovirgaria hyperparasitica]|uniref:Dynamin family protein n=1 Tax=Pseudovirgaria hyperparasitica TaxID=470096 RepID=A0A6A6VV24_9PEZI|nr:uncharacterized protein EJ05DRAFT_445395 [Pseudovirgaria hyperparasitica]KAF2753117.1 hypothetical protein EJ05DRAFT_445395 [Pseudovirgaria hyperparasitica]
METDASKYLQSNDTRSLLDVVDKLRSQGISKYVDLPEIVVCGEQSAGKSSVLEALSGMTFPSKDNLCTRFATELILRRALDESTDISIVPGVDPERCQAQTDMLHAFKVSDSDGPLDLGDVIERAKECMGITEFGKVFSSDILRIELSGPHQPHLTLVDLPGLFQAGSTTQSDEDCEIVKTMVRKYMQSPRSIILAVVSAKNDFNNQIITRYAREIDPQGERTLGLITKPDTLHAGSDSERFYVDLAQNKDVNFRLGWHLLRNRDYPARNTSLEERNKVEEDFFSKGIWTSLRPTQLGVAALKPRLSKVLRDQILLQLPHVLSQIEEGITDCTGRLDRLGASRATLSQQRRHLLQASEQFTALVQNAIDGSYSNPFFGKASTTSGRQKRLRAVVQNTLAEFEHSMRVDGHALEIVEVKDVKQKKQISRQSYIKNVKELLQHSRGRELAGLFDPLIVGELFGDQCQPWNNIVDTYVDKIVDAAYYLVQTALSHVCDQPTAEGILNHIVYSSMENFKAELHEKVTEIMRPHYEGHPITFNHYLTDNVQKAQAERRRKELEKSISGFFGDEFDSGDMNRVSFNMSSLLNLLNKQTETDMNNYASSTATDFMQAYYKVALKKVVDDISVLAIEACLVQRLPELFAPATVFDIDDTTVRTIASENEESVTERVRCSEKLNILEEGMVELKKLRKFQPIHSDCE